MIRPLVRKKSGELVKPSLKRTSSFPVSSRPSVKPTRPLSPSSVRFNTSIEQITYFSKADRPITISSHHPEHDANDEVLDDELEDQDNKDEMREKRIERDIQVDIPPATADYPLIRFESAHLSRDSSHLIGRIAVANLAYEKSVSARFTFDYWRSFTEVTASYIPPHRMKETLPNDGYDRFQFVIELEKMQTAPLFLAVRYCVNGGEFWDNNRGKDFKVVFYRRLSSLEGGGESQQEVFSKRYHLKDSLDRPAHAQKGISTVLPSGLQPRSRSTNPCSAEERGLRPKSLIHSLSYDTLLEKFCYFTTPSSESDSMIEEVKNSVDARSVPIYVPLA